MRVAQYYNNKDVRIEEIPVPKIGPGELLLKIHASGICGSDVMEWYRLGKVPRVLGHEVAGEIAEVGAGLAFKKGDRIAASHHVPCYQCHYCRLGHQTLCDTLRTTNFDPGGFAESVRLPAINCRYGIYKLPPHVSYEEATFIEPLACVLRGQEKINVRSGQTVLIIGCGAAGLLHLLLAKQRKAKRIIVCDVVDFRLETARQFGADLVLRSSDDLAKKIQEANEGRLADVVITCAGVKSVTLQALQSVDRGGTVLFFAPQSPDQVIPISMNELFWQKGISITSSYAASPEDHLTSLELISSNQIPVKRLISHRLGLSEVGKGFELVANASESLKVVINPSR